MMMEMTHNIDTIITEDGAFVWYHEGETAAKTPFDCMHKLINRYVIQRESLGGNAGK